MAQHLTHTHTHTRTTDMAAPADERGFFRTPRPASSITALALLAALYVLAERPSLLPEDVFSFPLRATALAHGATLQIINYAAWAAHAVEAVYVYTLAKKLGLTTAGKWALQTFIVSVLSVVCVCVCVCVVPLGL